VGLFFGEDMKRKNVNVSFMPIENWREQARTNEASKDVVLPCGETESIEEIEPSELSDDFKASGVDASRILRFTISTAAVDRDRDTIDPQGWDLKNFKKNPVVLWAHNYHEPPVARSIQHKIVEVKAAGPDKSSKLISTAEFMPQEMNEKSHMVHQMLKGGFLNATSVGFQPKEWVFNEERKGVDFSKQELLEYSIVPVPSNPEALIEARSAGINTGPYLEWCQKVLDEDGGGIWLPRKDIENMVLLLNGKKIISVGMKVEEEVEEVVEKKPELEPEKVPEPEVVVKAEEQIEALEEELFEIECLYFPISKWTMEQVLEWSQAETDVITEDGDFIELRQRPLSDFESCSRRKNFVIPGENGHFSVIEASGGALCEIEEVEKSGQVLSKKNRERLGKAITALQEILAEAEREAEPEQETIQEPVVAKPELEVQEINEPDGDEVLVLLEDDPIVEKEETFDVDINVLKETLSDVVKKELTMATGKIF